MPGRKEMKRRARRALKRHYILYVALFLIAAYIGAEFSSSLEVLDVTPAPGYEAQERLERPSDLNGGITGVMRDIFAGDEEAAGELAYENEEAQIARAAQESPVLGRTRGVLARMVNSVSSGSFVVSLLAALHSLVGSENAAILLLILLGTAVLFAVWFFFINVFTVITRRVLLEGRTYEKVPFQRILFLLRVRKWTKVCCTMFLVSFYQMLWNITIIGGIIKHYSYYLVPYIAAENPDIAPGEAIRLSRRLMKGHKWECFVFGLSFLPWRAPGGRRQAGLSETPVLQSPTGPPAFTEYYAGIRAAAKKAAPEGQRAPQRHLSLYEMPEDELIYLAYEDVISALDTPAIQGCPAADRRPQVFCGLGSACSSPIHEDRSGSMSRCRACRVKMELLKDALWTGRAYPSRLSAVPEVQKRQPHRDDPLPAGTTPCGPSVLLFLHLLRQRDGSGRSASIL